MLSCNICWTVYVQPQRVALDTIQAKQAILSTSFTCQRAPIWRSFGDSSRERTWSSLLLWALWYCGNLPPYLQFQERVGNVTSFPWDLFLLQGHVWLWDYQTQITQTKVHLPKINHKMAAAKKNLWSPTPLLNQGYPELVAQSCIQMALEDLQEGWLHKISGQPVTVLGQCQCKNISWCSDRNSCLVYALCLLSCHWQPLERACHHSFTYPYLYHVFMHVDKIPLRTISSPFPCSLSQGLLTHSTSKPHFP